MTTFGRLGGCGYVPQMFASRMALRWAALAVLGAVGIALLVRDVAQMSLDAGNLSAYVVAGVALVAAITSRRSEREKMMAAENDSLRKQNSDLRIESDDLRDTVSEMREERLQMHRDRDDMEQRFRTVEDELARLREAAAEKDARLRSLEARLRLTPSIAPESMPPGSY